MKLVRAALAIAVAALGVLALVLAHDLRSADAAIEHGDAQYARGAVGTHWKAGTWLPAGAATRALGLADDLALRRAEQALVVALAAPPGFDNGRRRSRLRAEAELALSDVIAAGSPAQASRAGNLTGILAGTAESEDGAAGEERAIEAFDSAIRADPKNTDAKYNLELVLRRIRVVGSREGAGGDAGDLGDALPGAGAGRPGSGY